jgi:uncharacterized LabA/DUF88 family protein
MRDGGIEEMCTHYAGGRQVVRTYLYTSAPHLEKAKVRHGPKFATGIRIVLGDAVPTGDGNFREKGVDALLVADLIYHAAAKNLDYAVLVSADNDFARALKRVEDFGCRTGVISVGVQLPELLRDATDDVHVLSAETIRAQAWSISRYGSAPAGE